MDSNQIQDNISEMKSLLDNPNKFKSKIKELKNENNQKREQYVQQLISILFTELDAESIVKLKNNKEFMDCINRLKDQDRTVDDGIEKVEAEIVVNINTEPSLDNNKRIVNVEGYEKHCKRNSIIDKF